MDKYYRHRYTADSFAELFGKSGRTHYSYAHSRILRLTLGVFQDLGYEIEVTCAHDTVRLGAVVPPGGKGRCLVKPAAKSLGVGASAAQNERLPSRFLRSQFSTGLNYMYGRIEV